MIVQAERGGQYPARVYREELAAHGMGASMSGTGDGYDHAMAERFFPTLEFVMLINRGQLTPPHVGKLDPSPKSP